MVQSEDEDFRVESFRLGVYGFGLRV